MAGFTYFSKLPEVCPICSGARSDCRRNDLTNFIHCRVDFPASLGWKQIRQDSKGFGVYAPDEVSEEDLQKARDQAIKAARQEKERLKASLSNAERDRQYSIIAQHCGLSDESREQLKLRMLTDAQIDQLVEKKIVWTWKPNEKIEGITKDLPGIFSNGATRKFGNDLTIGALSVSGRVLGAQVRSKDCYRWLSSTKCGGYGPRLQCGESPIGVYHLKEGKAELNITEGLLKPAIAASRLGGIWLGVVGRLYGSSPLQLTDLFSRYPDYQLILNPDAGAVRDFHTVVEYYKLYHLCRRLGRGLTIRWWVQVEKNHGDIDEIRVGTFNVAKKYTWPQFMGLVDTFLPADKKDDLRDFIKSRESYHGRSAA